MKSNKLKITAILALVLFLFPASIIFADKGENEIKFSGSIQSLPASGLIGDWVVSGTTVREIGRAHV